jgi:DNA-binding Lrp family transcriptional regulator
MAQMLGPCSRAKRCAKESGSALTMKLISPWRYSSTFLWRCRAMAVKPMRSNSAPIAAGSGAAYSMNSKPSVPIGLSQGVKSMCCSCCGPKHRTVRAVARRRSAQRGARGASRCRSFEKATVWAGPEVVECAALTGDMDYLLRVLVRDMAHYSRFIMAPLLEHPSVQDCKTSFVLQRLKATTALPV